LTGDSHRGGDARLSAIKTPSVKTGSGGFLSGGFPVRNSFSFPGYYPKDAAEDIFIYHGGTNLDQVVRNVLPRYPDFSFCFLNVGRLRETVKVIQRHFLPGHPGRRISYAVKANSRRKILEVLRDSGVDCFDCTSSGEMSLARSIHPFSEIMFNNPVRSSRDVAYALSLGVKHFAVQTKDDVRKVLDNASFPFVDEPLEMAVRMMMQNENARVDLSPKFGATPGEAEEMISEMRANSSCIPGIYVHVGSQNSSAEKYVAAIRTMSEISRRQGKLKIMNVGGGIPVRYKGQDKFDLVEYLEIISKAITDFALDSLDPEHKIIIELGRAVVAESVDMVIPILCEARRNGRDCLYINDGIFTSFWDAAIHKWRYWINAMGSDGCEIKGRGLKEYEVFGRTCDSGDTLGKLLLPEGLKEGDYLWLPNAGAYLDTLASRFSEFTAPFYVAYNTSNDEVS
jgi:ornithine decarboxylase